MQRAEPARNARFRPFPGRSGPLLPFAPQGRILALLSSVPSPVSCSDLALAIALLTLACASRTPEGPLFTPAPEPRPSDSLLYVYRVDDIGSRSAVKIMIDGRSSGDLRNGEYRWYHLPPGIHTLKTRFVSPLNLGGGWNTLEFETVAGQPSYMKMWAGYHQVERAPGRAGDTYGVNLFSSPRSGRTALPEIQDCSRASTAPR